MNARTRSLALAATGAGTLIAVLALVCAWLAYSAPGDAGAAVIVVESGQGAAAVAERLEEEGLIRSSTVLLVLMRLTGADRRLQPGEYAFEGGETPVEVAAKLVAGRVVTVDVTVPEGLTLEETAGALVGQGVGPLDELLEEFRDPSRVADIDPEARTLEGYLYPETYRLRKPVSAGQVADVMVATFRERFFAAHREQIATSSRSLRELVTLASLVEEETALDHEKPRIAGVFAERLDRGMRLQCDPTIIYGLKAEGRWDGNIRRRDLSWRHPYNTYVIKGLPPGPIASPGLAALRAALEPERTGDLYFVAAGDGSHEFSRTFTEHLKAVRRMLQR